MKLLYFLLTISLFACNRSGKLQKKLIDVSKENYWKILKWNKKDYSNDTLLLRFYANNEYDLFRFNKENKVVSLKPDSSSDILLYQRWEVSGDSLLSLKKKIDFLFSFENGDTLWFIKSENSLVLKPFVFSPQ